MRKDRSENGPHGALEEIFGVGQAFQSRSDGGEGSDKVREGTMNLRVEEAELTERWKEGKGGEDG